MKKNKSPRSGFTLIELLTVIAIIGILAAILIPTVGAVKKKASMVTSSSNLRQVALAYTNFSTSGTRTRSISEGSWAKGGSLANSPGEWAMVLADLGGLNDGPLYFITSADDVAGLSTIPGTIVVEGDSGAEAGEDWTGQTLEAISYEMAAGISPNAQSTVTPLIWTKGHNDTTSKWDLDSPWLGEGGHIAFVDGHVTYYETTENELVNKTDKKKTGSIQDAIGTSADILKTSGTASE